MYYYSSFRGVFFIILGAVLFFMVTGDLIFRISLGLLAIYLINYGFRLRGMPPLHTVLHSWLDRLQW